MENYQSLLTDLNKEFNGRARMITAQDGTISFIIKGQPAIMKNGIMDSSLATEDSKKTCVAVVQATDKRATLPASNTQLGGFSKRNLGGLTVKSLVFRDIATRTMYIPIPKQEVVKPASGNKPETVSYVLPKQGKEVLDMLQSDNGTALKDRAFVTVESFNPYLVMSAGQIRRIQVLEQELANATSVSEKTELKAKITAVISSMRKRAYKRNEKNERIVDAKNLVEISAPRMLNGKIVNAPVFTGHILLGGLTDISPSVKDINGNAMEFDSFYVYRAVETVNPDGTKSVTYVKGGISEEARLQNDVVDGVSEGEMSIPSPENTVKTDETILEKA
jgi:hypothetical protein